MTEGKQLTVFYNGACPICAREIMFYRRRSEADEFSWIDIRGFREDEELRVRARTEAGACVHLLYADGTLVSGREALVGLWAALLGFRLWSKFFRVATATPSHDLPLGQGEAREIVLVKKDKAELAKTRRFPFKGIIHFPGRHFSRGH